MFQELERYREGLLRYIESTYHISHTHLVRARGELLRETGALAQLPHIESTPRFKTDRPFKALHELPGPVRELLIMLSQPRSDGPPLIFDPPYSHQAEALTAALGEHHRDLLITTGTGSGKTEAFLLPILGRLYEEAALRPAAFGQRGLRALILYPMNALVNDQLARLRLLFASEPVRQAFMNVAGRPARFARYTGRTLFPGVIPEDTQKGRQKLGRKLAPLRFYDRLARITDPEAPGAKLREELKKRGKWPGKSDFVRWFRGTHGGKYFHDGELARTVTLPEDAELILRHEVHTELPDILMTNYSMLEYTLLRPIERGMWAQAQAYFQANPGERLLLILDEAHLYRGAAGTEVAMLLRRFRQRIGIAAEQLQVICTSASFDDEVKARRFASQLSGKPKRGFDVLRGDKRAMLPSGPGTATEGKSLCAVSLRTLHAAERGGRVAAIASMLRVDGTNLPEVPLVSSLSSDDPILTLRGYDGRLKPRELTGRASELQGDGGWSILTELKVDTSAVTHAPINGTVGLSNLPDLFVIEDGNPRLTVDPLSAPLNHVLSKRPVVGRLLNLTSGARTSTDPETLKEGLAAQELSVLSDRLFDSWGTGEQRRAATDVLLELAALSRAPGAGTPLLAARVHAFFRALPGLWVCLDPGCTELPPERRGGPCGALHAQPSERCPCGAKMLELHTCRGCGLALAIGYTFNPEKPTFVYPMEGGVGGSAQERLSGLHLVLERPLEGTQLGRFREEYLDPQTRRLDSGADHARPVWLAIPDEKRKRAWQRKGTHAESPGIFAACPRCAERGKISGHQTAGDQPFQELVSTQLLEQPPRAESKTPLKGRKVLIFSDGRQAASRLAGNLKAFALNDAVRPLLLEGYRELSSRGITPLRLSHAYPALLLGCARRDVHLPVFDSALDAVREGQREARELLISGIPQHLESFCEALMGQTPPELLLALYGVIFDPYRGLEALALASFDAILPVHMSKDFGKLEEPRPLGSREQLLTEWARAAARERVVELCPSKSEWRDCDTGPTLNRMSGKFEGTLKGVLPKGFFSRSFSNRGGKKSPWLSFVTRCFSDNTGNEQGFLATSAGIAIVLGEKLSWTRCRSCTRVRPVSTLGVACGCKAPVLEALDPEQEPRFQARAGYYRRHAERMQREKDFTPHPFDSAEHSAAISETLQDQLYSRTETYELRFQDISVPMDLRNDDLRAPPLDVLSCTTTMEVGIDIGSLTGVALRNVPPGRANYQQRAGRAGRRGSSLATVVTYAGADSHDQRFFSEPAAMVAGPVLDPFLKLDNIQIIRRHIFALLLSAFQVEALVVEEGGDANLFTSLGSVSSFRTGDPNSFSFRSLEGWLDTHQERIDTMVAEVLPAELLLSLGNSEVKTNWRAELLAALRAAGLDARDLPGSGEAVAEDESVMSADADAQDTQWDDLLEEEDWEVGSSSAELDNPGNEEEDSEGSPVGGKSEGAENPDAAGDDCNLLDRLFRIGLLPRYAFPTDVVAFHVFEPEASGYGAPRLRYSPQQGLATALSQYAPGKEVWVDGKRFYSFAIWSAFGEHYENYRQARFHLQCSRCEHVEVYSDRSDLLGRFLDCPACQTPKGLGPGRRWIVPAGFAHPVGMPERLPGEPGKLRSRPTGARLSKPLPTSDLTEHWDGRVKIWTGRADLTLTNAGPEDPTQGEQGFRYCTRCGRAEPVGWPDGQLQVGGTHEPPTPTRPGDERTCAGRVAVVVLGHEFQTDIALIRLTFREGVRLPPGSLEAAVTGRSLAEAFAAAARQVLELDQGELGAETRVPQTKAGSRGDELELFLYDTVPGGAGYSTMVAQRLPELLNAAANLLKGCKGNCDSSCYDCLRSYRNRWFHSSLDRHMAADLLDHVRTGRAPVLAPKLETRALKELASFLEDEQRQVEQGDGRLLVEGHEVSVVHPLLAESHAGTPEMLSYLLVTRSLPNAIAKLNFGCDADAPSGPTLLPRGQGMPVYSLETMEAALRDPMLSLGGLPEPKQLSGQFFAIRLDTGIQSSRLLGNVLLEAGTIVQCRRTPLNRMPNHQLIQKGTLLVLRHPGEVFKATGTSITVADAELFPREEPSSVRVRYSSQLRAAVTERVPLEDLEVLGIVKRVLVG